MIKHRVLILFVVLTQSLVLSACSTDVGVEGTPLADMTFAHLQPWPVNVARIDVRIEDTLSVPDFVKPPEDIAREYINARFRPAGPVGILDIKVKQAKVEKSYIEPENSIAQFIGFGGGDAYKVTYQIQLDHMNGTGLTLSSHVVSATRTINISEHVSISEREQRQQAGLEKLFQELDRQIETILGRDLSLFRKQPMAPVTLIAP